MSPVTSAGPLPSRPRNVSVDFAKGALVVLMFLYHWMNYFITPSGDIYRYLRFITPSFIFITGFLISTVYAPRYDSANLSMDRRLWWRGIKLLLLFTLLNLLAGAAIGRNYNGAEFGVVAFFRNAHAVYVQGNAQRAVFEVLVPIGYVLLLAPILLRGAAAMRRPPAWLAFAFFSVVLIINSLGLSSGNLDLMGLGFLGMAVGGVPPNRLGSVLDRSGWLVLAYLLYAGAVTIWNVVFVVQAVAVCVNLWLLYWLGSRYGCTRRVVPWIVELGKYTLFAYIFHIVVLQVLRRVLPVAEWPHISISTALLVVSVGTLLAVKATALARARFAAADRLYQWVLG